MSSLTEPTFTLESRKRMTALYRQNNELNVYVYDMHIQCIVHPNTPQYFLKTADRSSSIIFNTASGFLEQKSAKLMLTGR